MKYLVSWTYRLTGSAQENEATLRRGLAVYSKWTPPATTTYHQFLARLDGSGGAAVIETDNPADITETAGKFAFMLDYQVVPVVDIADGIQAMIAGIDFLESVP